MAAVPRRLGLGRLAALMPDETQESAVRFLETSLRAWAFARACQSADGRAKATPNWLRGCSTTRPNSALGGRPPITRMTRHTAGGSDSSLNQPHLGAPKRSTRRK